MMERPSPSIYPANLTDLLAVSYQGDRLGDGFDRSSSPVSTEEDSQSAFGVDLTGKTNLAGKSFTIAAILGLSGAEEDAMNLSVERLRSPRELGYWAGHEIHRLNEGFCRMAPPGLRQADQGMILIIPQNVWYVKDSPRPETKPPQMKTARNHALSCTSSSGRSKRIRTIFTPEQLERLEAEFERQQYMVGPERLYLAHALQLTEAQVKVWFQNRRIKWRKHHLEVTQQRLAVLQRHRPDGDEDL